MRSLRVYLLAVAVVLLSAGCGGGGSDSGGDSSDDSGFTNNISGVWTGVVNPGDFATTVVINQTVSGSLVGVHGATVGINGTVTFPEFSDLPMSGTKDGNNITMQLVNPANDITATFEGALTDANTMSGDYSQSNGFVGVFFLSR